MPRPDQRQGQRGAEDLLCLHRHGQVPGARAELRAAGRGRTSSPDATQPVEDAATVTKADRGLAAIASRQVLCGPPGACVRGLLGHVRQPQLKATTGPPTPGSRNPCAGVGNAAPRPRKRLPSFSSSFRSRCCWSAVVVTDPPHGRELHGDLFSRHRRTETSSWHGLDAFHPSDQLRLPYFSLRRSGEWSWKGSFTCTDGFKQWGENPSGRTWVTCCLWHVFNTLSARPVLSSFPFSL